MGVNFLNASLIPVLCRHAGLPEHDALGAITGHRARSTIATMLRKNGVSLEDISQFLGHANPEMVKAYARTDPFRFGRDMLKANDLMRIVEGIIDTRAAKAGKPNVFFFLVQVQKTMCAREESSSRKRVGIQKSRCVRASQTHPV